MFKQWLYQMDLKLGLKMIAIFSIAPLSPIEVEEGCEPVELATSKIDVINVIDGWLIAHDMNQAIADSWFDVALQEALLKIGRVIPGKYELESGHILLVT